MVIRANKTADGIGGHLSTYASRRSLYEVGFNHFFKGKEDGLPGDHVYFQGHAAPGIYARAFLEGRLTEATARPLPAGGRRQRTVQLPPPAAHARLLGVPDRLDGSRPDQLDLPGPLQQVPAPPPHRRHLAEQRLGFLGDGEIRRTRDAGRHLAGRPRRARQSDVGRQLQPPAPRRSGPRQRQDHPGTRGRLPRRRLERHQGGVGHQVGRAPPPRRRRCAAQQDERRRSTASTSASPSRTAPTSASTSSAPTPGCASWSSTSPTTSSQRCPAAATTTRRSTPPSRPPRRPRTSRPSSWPRPIKGWTLGEGFEGRNATHQIKKMTKSQLLELRERLHLEDEIPEESLEDGIPAVLPARRPTPPSAST